MGWLCASQLYWAKACGYAIECRDFMQGSTSNQIADSRLL